jgi:RND superfamily putative drug exporter
LGRRIVLHPIITTVGWALAAGLGICLAFVGVTGDGLFDRVNSYAPRAEDSDSARADDLIEEGRQSAEVVTLAVANVKLSDPQVIEQLFSPLAKARADLAQIDGLASTAAEGDIPMVLDPLNPTACPAAPPPENPVERSICALEHNPLLQGLVASDRQGFLMTVDIAKGLDAGTQERATDQVIDRLQQAAKDIEADVDGARASVGSDSMIMDELIGDMRHDLELGELISLPIALVVMVLVFAGFLAAAMPVIGAMVSILVCMGAVFGLTYVSDIHTSVVNVITLVGLGLSIDYGLLVVSRFREELRHAGAYQLDDAAQKRAVAHAAVVSTVATAGRTVFYSALTIAVCIAGLMAFDIEILRVYGMSGLLVVLLALGTAVTLVPALLTLVGHHLTGRSVLTRIPGLSKLYARASDVSPDEGVFSRLTLRVQRHPWWVIGGVLAILVAVGWPIHGIELRNSTVELLPASSPQREFLTELEEGYPLSSPESIRIVSTGSREATDRFAMKELQDIPGTELLVGQDGQAAIEHTGYSMVTMTVTAADPEGPQARDAVTKIRQVQPTDYQVYVTGPAARLVDFEDKLAKGGPWAGVIIALAVLVLLFLFTGSVLVPIKALITNALSLVACLGVVTWIFQDGHFTKLLGFTPMTGIESYIVVLLVIFGFGLAMDYEVFLISRIKEAWDKDPDPARSVRDGLQHSGRIISSAALIIVAVFLGFAAGRLVVIKEIGIGLALAVTMDATLIRMLLVPATMSILGKWNWWAPRPLARLHKRFSVKH